MQARAGGGETSLQEDVAVLGNVLSEGVDGAQLAKAPPNEAGGARVDLQDGRARAAHIIGDGTACLEDVDQVGPVDLDARHSVVLALLGVGGYRVSPGRALARSHLGEIGRRLGRVAREVERGLHRCLDARVGAFHVDLRREIGRLEELDRVAPAQGLGLGVGVGVGA